MGASQKWATVGQVAQAVSSGLSTRFVREDLTAQINGVNQDFVPAGMWIPGTVEVWPFWIHLVVAPVIGERLVIRYVSA